MAAQMSDNAYEIALLTSVLSHKPKYQSNHFAVVAQPALVNSNLPIVGSSGDVSYLSPDCFHWSAKMHQQVAIQVFNAMLSSEKVKPLSVHFGQPLSCPTPAAPFICTNSNKCGAV